MAPCAESLSIKLPPNQTAQERHQRPLAAPAAPAQAPAHATPNLRASASTSNGVPTTFRYAKARLLKDCNGGSVFLGCDYHAKRCVIIKEMDTTNAVTRRTIENEIKVHGFLSQQPDCSPRIVKLLDVVRSPGTTSLIMEFAEGGEVYNYAEALSHSGLSTTTRRQIAKKAIRQAVEGLIFLHDNNVAHLDLTPENLMLDHDGNIKIIDFGISHLCGPLCVEHAENKMTDEAGHHLKDAVGKMRYMAPEVYAANQTYDGRQADLWSLGVVMFMLLFGFPPVDCPDPYVDKRIVKILKGQLADLVAMWDLDVEPEALDLLQKLLAPTGAHNPYDLPADTQRISLADVTAHPYFGQR